MRMVSRLSLHETWPKSDATKIATRPCDDFVSEALSKMVLAFISVIIVHIPAMAPWSIDNQRVGMSYDPLLLGFS